MMRGDAARSTEGNMIVHVHIIRRNTLLVHTLRDNLQYGRVYVRVRYSMYYGVYVGLYVLFRGVVTQGAAEAPRVLRAHRH